MVKCRVCGSEEDVRCALMRVVVKEDGGEAWCCCENLQKEKKKEI